MGLHKETEAFDYKLVSATLTLLFEEEEMLKVQIKEVVSRSLFLFHEFALEEKKKPVKKTKSSKQMPVEEGKDEKEKTPAPIPKTSSHVTTKKSGL